MFVCVCVCLSEYSKEEEQEDRNVVQVELILRPKQRAPSSRFFDSSWPKPKILDVSKGHVSYAPSQYTYTVHIQKHVTYLLTTAPQSGTFHPCPPQKPHSSLNEWTRPKYCILSVELKRPRRPSSLSSSSSFRVPTHTVVSFSVISFILLQGSKPIIGSFLVQGNQLTAAAACSCKLGILGPIFSLSYLYQTALFSLPPSSQMIPRNFTISPSNFNGNGSYQMTGNQDTTVSAQ